ncbi:MAG: hypothetical protein ACRC46_15540 [Thermoguttaceae bacterium]
MANNGDPKSVGQDSENVVSDKDFNFDEFFAQPQPSDDPFAVGISTFPEEGIFGSAGDVPVDEPSEGTVSDETADDVNEFADAAVGATVGAAAYEASASEESSEGVVASGDEASPDDAAGTAVADANDGKTEKKRRWPWSRGGKGEKKRTVPQGVEVHRDEELVRLNRRWLGVACAWGAVLLAGNVATIVAPPAATSTTSLIIYLAILNTFGCAALAAPIMLLRTEKKDDKASVYTFILCLSMMAAVLAATILLTELFRYDFTTKIS